MRTALGHIDIILLRLFFLPAAVSLQLQEGGQRREPASSAQVAKKKVLEKLAPGLHTDASGTAFWGDSAFTVGRLGTVGSALPNGVVG